jgi:thiamine kinase-like enzyme
MLAEAQEALLGLLGAPEGPAVALDGGITNRNYRVRWAGRDCVLRLPGGDTALLGIDRRAEHAAALAAAAAGVAPEVVAFEPVLGCLVTRFVEGRPMAAGELRGRVPELAATLRTIHAGPPIPARFDTAAIVDAYVAVARARGGHVPAAVEPLAAAARRVRAALTGPEHAPVPCHNDLLPANVLDGGGRLWIVDWEYAGMGDRYFDLGNASVNNGFGEAEDRALLTAYFGEATPARFAALRLMRAMSDVREGMWGVVQGAISDLEFDFAAYADEHLARALAAVEDPRFEEWLARAA